MFDLLADTALSATLAWWLVSRIGWLGRFFDRHARLAYVYSIAVSIAFSLAMLMPPIVIVAASLTTTLIMNKYFQARRTGLLKIAHKVVKDNVRVVHTQARRTAKVAKFTYRTVRFPLTIGEKVLDIVIPQEEDPHA